MWRSIGAALLLSGVMGERAPAVFRVMNGCGRPVEFRLTDDEVMRPSWQTMMPGADLGIVADRSPVDAFWFEVRTGPGRPSVTYQPKTDDVLFAGDVCPP